MCISVIMAYNDTTLPIQYFLHVLTQLVYFAQFLEKTPEPA